MKCGAKLSNLISVHERHLMLKHIKRKRGCRSTSDEEGTHHKRMFTNDALMFEAMNGLDIILRRVVTGDTELPVPWSFIHSVCMKVLQVLVYDSANQCTAAKTKVSLGCVM